MRIFNRLDKREPVPTFRQDQRSRVLYRRAGQVVLGIILFLAGWAGAIMWLSREVK